MADYYDVIHAFIGGLCKKDCTFRLQQGSTHMFDEGPAGFCQLHTFGVTNEQGRVELFFQLCDLFA
jgi:hypothetical protein